jgi:hypothetical protein
VGRERRKFGERVSAERINSIKKVVAGVCVLEMAMREKMKE